MNKTAIIYSDEEIEKMPLKDRPLCKRISGELYTAIHEAIGEASMCWNPRPSNEVFASEQASDVAVRLCFKVANEIEDNFLTQITERDSRIEALKHELMVTKASEKYNSDYARAYELQIGKLVTALKPLGSGVDFINWGKIKALLPTDLARDLTKLNCAADEAIESSKAN